MLLKLAGLLFVTFALLACHPPQQTPEEVVNAFAKALEKDDYPAMARLVAGGKPSFQYSKLRTGEYQRWDMVYSEFKVKILSVKIDGDTAIVTGSYSSKAKDGSGGGSADKEVIPLKLDGGEWKIVPYTKTSPTGYFIEELAAVLADPDKELASMNAAFAGTRNISPAEVKLGKDRTEFFLEVLETEGPEPGNVPYSGYKSMTMVEHTLMFWPAGRADEVIFNMGLEGSGNYLTCWRKVDGKPKRLWQVKLTNYGMRKRSFDGTLAKWLRQSRQWPATVSNPALKEVLQANRPYAAYIEVGAISSYICWVLRADGTSDPKKSTYGPHSTMQDSYQLRNKGFFITPEETLLLGVGKP